LDWNTYDSEKEKDKDISQMGYDLNHPYRINLTSDMQWSSLELDTTAGNTCSYKFDFTPNSNNMY
jgi:hypothetical protein